jgi:glycosyltransferase involved in cell wall biosynthesis
MRILHISSATSWRGGEQQIAYLIEELTKYGVDNLLLCPMGSVLAEREIPELILKIRYQKRGSIDLFVSRTLKQIAQTENIDIIHIHDSHAHNYAWAAASFWRMKTPCIVTRRVDFGIHKTSHRKYNHPSIKHIICVSDYIKDQLAGTLKNPERILRIYSGIDVKKFKNKKSKFFRKKYNLSKNCLLFGNIAAIAAHKDYKTFVELAKLYREQELPEARFLIIGGDAGQEKKIQKLVHQYELQEFVLFTGFQEEIDKKIFELDALICTSKMEGLGTSVLDAFAAKVPVVSTEAGGLPEIAIHETTALTSEIENPEALLNNLKRLISNEKLKIQLIDQAHLFVQDFQIKKVKRQVFELYESVLQELTD